MAVKLTEEQALAATARGEDLLVSAAAGSGKTRVLVERLLLRVCGPEARDVDEFLVLTFTKAAAAELRSRVRQEISARLAEHPRNAHLRRQMTLIYQADITTIDAFCTKVVRENAALCGLPADFRVADETEAGLLRDRVLEELIEERYEEGDEAFLGLTDTLAAGRDDRRLREIVLQLHASLQSHADPMGWTERLAEFLDPGFFQDPGETPWGEEVLGAVERAARFGEELLCDCLEEMAPWDRLLEAYGPAFEQDLEGARLLASAAEQGWQAAWEALHSLSSLRLKPLKNFEDTALQERLKGRRKRWHETLKDMGQWLEGSATEVREDLEAVLPVAQALFELLRAFDARFREEKRRRGIADFGDLEHLTAGLLRTPEGEPSDLARVLGERYCEVMVDEYQDVNDCQESILTALGRGNCFFVGDMKQSIYRFRLADPRIFLGKYREWPLAESPELEEKSKVLLSRNFRSRAGVLGAANFLFSRVMRRGTGELDYTDREALYPGASFPGEDPPVELWLADGRGRRDMAEEDRLSAAQLEAELAARRIQELLEQGTQVADGDGLRPLRPGDIVILLRSPAGRAESYRRALQQRGIPCAIEQRGDPWNVTERAVILALLSVIDNPRQDVMLVAALRSPLFALSADELSELRADCPEGDYFDAVVQAAQAGDGKCRAFLDFLEEFRLLAPDLSVEALLRRLYERTDLPALVGAMPEGAERQRNLMDMLRLAREFEQVSFKGLFSFLRFLERYIEEGRAPAGAESGQGDAVRVMSIHKSKGLEFPVVLVSGLGSRFNRQDLNAPVLLHPELGAGFRRLDRSRRLEWPTAPRQAIALRQDREMLAEEMRLLYVAMTRPTERLILTGTCPDLGQALRRCEGSMTAGGLSDQAILGAACPLDWLLFALLPTWEAGPLREAYELPQSSGETGCGWLLRWEEAQALLPEEEAGAEGEVRPLPPPDPQAVEATLEALTFVYPFGESVDLPSKVTATQIKGRFQDEESAENAPLERPPAPLARPAFLTGRKGLTGAERGIATHLAMQCLDFGRCATLEGIREELERMRRQELLTPEQVDGVRPETLFAFFQSPLGGRVLSARELLREFKFSLLVPHQGEELLLQGVVDCAFLQENGWSVLDFKTDQVRPGQEARRAEEYRGQLETYAYALKRITGRGVAEKIVYFFQTETAVTL